jgi:hypothetical protein
MMSTEPVFFHLETTAGAHCVDGIKTALQAFF